LFFSYSIYLHRCGFWSERNFQYKSTSTASAYLNAVIIRLWFTKTFSLYTFFILLSTLSSTTICKISVFICFSHNIHEYGRNTQVKLKICRTSDWMSKTFPFIELQKVPTFPNHSNQGDAMLILPRADFVDHSFHNLTFH